MQILESQVHLPNTHGQEPRQCKVWCRSDITMPSRECSSALLEHGFVWTSCIHFGAHIQTFWREHEMYWSNRDQQQLLKGSEPLWLVYFGFINPPRSQTSHVVDHGDLRMAPKTGLGTSNPRD